MLTEEVFEFQCAKLKGSGHHWKFFLIELKYGDLRGWRIDEVNAKLYIHIFHALRASYSEQVDLLRCQISSK